MRACVLALVPIALAQPAHARSHSHHHATHHSSRHHHYAEHHRHHHHHSRVRHYESWGQDEGMRQIPQTFARTDAWESAWQPDTMQPNSARARSTRRHGTQQSWLQPSPLQPAQPSWPRQSRARQPLDQNRSPESWQTRDAGLLSPGFSQVPATSGGDALVTRPAAGRVSHGAIDAMIERHAAANGVPAALVHRVVIRESRYNPRASNRGALGLMQIKFATARGVGYSGSASGLFDAETNLTYAVRYLAGAYKAAGGNANRAVALYASGYYRRGSAVAARRERPAVVAQQPASTWGGQQWDVQTERVAMRDTDMTAVRVSLGHRARHRR